MNIRQFLLPTLLMTAFLCSSCSQDTSVMRNGYYTAEAASFDADGWKEFMTIFVSDNKIVTVEYNARNLSGFVKSWDLEYMNREKTKAGIYPNSYLRAYAADLLSKQTPDAIRPIAADKTHYKSFQLLAGATIALAKEGTTNVAVIELPTGTD